MTADGTVTEPEPVSRGRVGGGEVEPQEHVAAGRRRAAPECMQRRGRWACSWLTVKGVAEAGWCWDGDGAAALPHGGAQRHGSDQQEGGTGWSWRGG